MSNTKKALFSLLVLGLMSTFVSLGSYALFTTSTTNSNNVFSTGTLSLNNSNGASATASLGNMVPGDSVDGVITLNNTGTEDVTNYQLATSVTAGSPTNPNVLSTDAANGLHIWVSRCSVAWGGSAPNYTCGGTQSNVLGTQANPVPIITAGSSLAPNAFCSNSAAAAAQRGARGVTCTVTGFDHLRIEVSLPSTAGNSFQGLTTTVDFTFKGQQAAGANF